MKPINYKALGAKIKEYRKKENITQEQLAEMADISLSHMSNAEVSTGCVRVNHSCEILNLSPGRQNFQ